MGAIDFGVYIHFPWCRKLCPYCDFAVEVGEPPHQAYEAAIVAELAARAEPYSGRLVSVYFGGGTPSLWDPESVARVLAAVAARWNAPAEVTLEANPTDVDAAHLAAWHAAGVNRLSIGVQSHHADELVTLGRDHRFGDGPAATERALADGRFALSVDFILGVPPHGRAIAPPATGHASIYELTIEERTAFGQRVRDGRLVPLDDDALADRYTAADAAMAAAGFEHYEISSYARPGQRAIHNSLYWRGAPYLGLGVGAASLALDPDGAGTRATNPRRAAAYLAGAPAEVTRVSAYDMATDRMWLGMRTRDGVDTLPADLGARLVDEGLAERRDGRICPTLRGFLMADRIATRIVQAR